MPHLILIPWLFALGACVGSFLNVVVWRLPRGESLVTPPSHCPKCNTPLAWYDNIPVFGWIFLRGRCRYCKEPISARYPIIEAVTGLLFAFYYVMFFMLHRGLTCSVSEVVRAHVTFANDWAMYMLYMWLISALLASSLIDAELFIIEPWVVWVTAGLAILTHGLLDRNTVAGTLSTLEPASAALAAGAGIGWLISGVLWLMGKMPISFPEGEPILEAQRDEIEDEIRAAKKRGEEVEPLPPPYTSNQIRLEMRKEMVFLMPALVLGGAMVVLTLPGKPLANFWIHAYGHDWLRGLLGALLGGMVGGFTIWITRILGTLGFGRVAMGRGDTDLMFAIGAVLGAGPAVVTFFLAPFFGILVAVYMLLFKKHREIPYGPYLSLAAAFVMVAYCPIADHFGPDLRNAFEAIVLRVMGRYRNVMGTTWLKIKVWTKVTVFSLVGLIVIIMLSRNWDTRVPHVDLLFEKWEQPRLLVVLLMDSIFSIFGWWLFRTIFKTMRQMRDVRRRSHLERIEREHADMIAKAAKLQTRPEAAPKTP